jgi:5'-deoxynucleotidase YfbR-like HD superfamily hydrolase
MSLIHDLAESIVGDLTPNDKIDKATKEKLENVKLYHRKNFGSFSFKVFC